MRRRGGKTGCRMRTRGRGRTGYWMEKETGEGREVEGGFAWRVKEKDERRVRGGKRGRKEICGAKNREKGK